MRIQPLQQRFTQSILTPVSVMLCSVAASSSMSFGIDEDKLIPINQLESSSTHTLDSITAEEGLLDVNNGFAIGHQLSGTSTSTIQVGTQSGGLLDTTLAEDTIINIINEDGQDGIVTTDDRGGATAIYATYAELGAIKGTLNATSYGETHGVSLSNSSITEMSGTINVRELEAVPSAKTPENEVTSGLRLTSSSSIDELSGTVNVTSQLDARGADVLSNSTIKRITGTFNVTSEIGVAEGIYFGAANSDIIIDGATFNITTNSDSSKATGLDFSTEGSGVNGNGINANMNVQGVGGQLSWIVTRQAAGSSNIITGEGSNLGVISGTYTLNSTTLIPSTESFSVGYLMGAQAQGTSFALGFRNSMTQNSDGMAINWEDIRMTVQRSVGLAGGLVVVSHRLDTPVDIGAESSITGISGLGGSVGAWLNGSDLGDVKGTISAVGMGSSAAGMPETVVTGLLATGHSSANSVKVIQSDENSSIGDISGTVSATIGENGRATALIIGHSDDVRVTGSVWSPTIELTRVNYESTVGTISGTIAAQSLTDQGVTVVGIQDISANTLKFANGATVSATVNSNNKLAEFGTAILNSTQGIRVSSSALNTSGAVNIIGNLDAGEKILQFEQGRYNVESHNWMASESVTVGKGRETAGDLSTAYQISRVNLVDMVSSTADAGFSKNTTLATSTLNFYTNNASDSSQIYVGSGRGLEFDGLEIVKVYLTGSEADYTSRLYFVDALSADIFDEDNTGITYNIYFDDSTTAHTQHDNFKIIHDSTGIYLHIPEPSTATLSLLALSGLLARRRRHV